MVESGALVSISTILSSDAFKSEQGCWGGVEARFTIASSEESHGTGLVEEEFSDPPKKRVPPPVATGWVVKPSSGSDGEMLGPTVAWLN